MKVRKTTLHIFKKAVSFLTAAALILPDIAGCKTEIPAKAAEANITYGDVNSDGVINIIDMIMLKSYITENNTKGFSVKAADIDDDGKVSSKDAAELCMYLLSQISSFSCEMNIDTDGDGICDYIEKEILGTDYKSKDTDGDGLDDYAEVYLCNTDPLIADTEKTGIKDSDKDADGDRLTNAEEIKLGTSPSMTDTDEDGLSDYDEVKKHKTDPLKADTDNDGISDLGEVKLGLNPLKEKSDGTTYDAEKVFDQKLGTDSEVLNNINSEESPYKLSVSVKAAGYIDESISVDISSYSNYLQNDAVEGDIIDIAYADSYKVENVTINFNISGNAENFYIFRYFEDVNMLLPVETQYDGNIVYTESTEGGTYCIVDMDKWIENTVVLSEAENISTLYKYNAVYDSSDMKSAENLEVYFLMYVRSTVADSARSSVANASRAIIDYCNNTGKEVKIYFATYTGDIVKSKENGNSYVSNVSTDDEIKEMLSRSGSATGSLDTTNFNYSLTRTLKRSLLDISSANENSNKYCFVVDVNFQPSSAANVVVVDEMKSYGVDFSFICNDYNDNIANYENLSSDGSHYRWIPDFSEIVIDKVLNCTIAYNVNTGLFNKIPYDEKLITSEWKDIYDKYYSKSLSKDDREKLLEEIKKLGLPDTDGDGCPDCLEIFMEFITFDENGNIILPTYDQLAKDALKNSPFGLKGLEELAGLMKKKGIDISSMRILPLISDPVIGDSDGDGIDDNEDEFTASTDSIEIDNNLLNDSYIFLDDNEIEELISTNCLNPNIDIYNIGYSFNDKKLPSCGVLKGSPVYEGNKFVTNKPEIEYTRYYDRKSYYKYTIFNDQNSDYDITINSDEIENFDIEVYDITWGKRGGKKVTSIETQTDKQKEYKFSLKEDRMRYV